MDNNHAQDLGFIQFPSVTDGLGSPESLQHHDRATEVEEQWNDEAHSFDEYHHLGQVRFPLFGGKVFKAKGSV